MSARDDKKTRKCPCGKTIKVKNRRILCKVEDSRDVPSVVQEFQDAIYSSHGFVTADKIK